MSFLTINDGEVAGGQRYINADQITAATISYKDDKLDSVTIELEGGPRINARNHPYTQNRVDQFTTRLCMDLADWIKSQTRVGLYATRIDSPPSSPREQHEYFVDPSKIVELKTFGNDQLVIRMRGGAESQPKAGAPEGCDLRYAAGSLQTFIEGVVNPHPPIVGAQLAQAAKIGPGTSLLRASLVRPQPKPGVASPSYDDQLVANLMPGLRPSVTWLEPVLGLPRDSWDAVTALDRCFLRWKFCGSKGGCDIVTVALDSSAPNKVFISGAQDDELAVDLRQPAAASVIATAISDRLVSTNRSAYNENSPAVRVPPAKPPMPPLPTGRSHGGMDKGRTIV